jgi:hypothetical protein
MRGALESRFPLMHGPEARIQLQMVAQMLDGAQQELHLNLCVAHAGSFGHSR